MLTKEKVKQSIEKLPDTFTIDDLVEQLIFIEKVEEGIKQSDAGDVISDEELNEIIDKWSK